MNKPLLLALMGPTASGKTALAIQLAQHFKTHILSVDSRQVYRGLTIGAATPTAAEQVAAPHHFVETLDLEQPYSAGHFARDARALLAKLFLDHDVVIAAGGSTLYFDALLHGVDAFPEVKPEVRDTVQTWLEQEGVEGLSRRLAELDQEYHAAVDLQNPRRLTRALEVCLAEGKPYSAYLGQGRTELPYQVKKVVLDIPRDVLYSRINARCDTMLEEGLLEEVKSLYPLRHLQALQTVGYTEFFDYLDGKTTYEEAVTLFKQHTRNYAKRQLTWFRREADAVWLKAPDLDSVLKAIG